MPVPLDEFLKVHRQGNLKDAINWAIKAFESTLKAICTDRGSTFDPQSATAKQLVDTVYAGELVPSYSPTTSRLTGSAIKRESESRRPGNGRRTRTKKYRVHGWC